MSNNLILASGSQIRATILRNANIPFSIEKTNTDEPAIKNAGLAEGKDLETIALDLAKAKAQAVIADKNTLVLGADQILEFENEPYDKPTSKEEAFARLKKLAGKTHFLINASVVYLDGTLIYENIEKPSLAVRSMTDADLKAYFSAVDDSVLSSVGAYQVEGPGVRLFDHIDGDYFAVLGLALYPLLPILRSYNIIDF